MQSQQTSSAEPVTLPYLDAPTGVVVASEAALEALKKTRRWALVFAVVLFVGAAAGGGLGTLWLVVFLVKRGEPGFPADKFVRLSTPNLVLAPVALAGAVLALRFIAAAGRAYNGRSSRDLERAMVAQKHVWLWAAATAVALFSVPVIFVIVARTRGGWP